LTVDNLSHRYLWADAVDQLLADEQLQATASGYDLSSPGTVLLPLTDQLGTVRDLAVCENGVTSVANHRVYDSYGNLKSETNAAVDCIFGFTGRPWDERTGLSSNGNRWYDPRVARWASEDPLGFEGGDANVGRYCGNSPMNGIDPTGLDVWIENTKSVGGWHRRITVELHDKDGNVIGTYSIAFGQDSGAPAHHGVVYRDTDPPLHKTILLHLNTTPEQDAEILKLFKSL